MTSTAAPGIVAGTRRRAAAVLDIVDALDLVSTAVDDRGRDFVHRPVSGPGVINDAYRYAVGGEPRCIVGHALSLANVATEELESMHEPVRDLYSDGRLPIPITLGALIVLDAAQRSEADGSPWGDVLDDAFAAAEKVRDLFYLVADVPQSARRCRTRCLIRGHERCARSRRTESRLTRPGLSCHTA